MLAYLGHEPPLKADLSARENLRYWIGVRRRVGAAELDAALERVGGGSWCERLVRTLSAGQRRRVALAGLALLAVPLWLLDEPDDQSRCRRDSSWWATSSASSSRAAAWWSRPCIRVCPRRCASCTRLELAA